MAKVGAQSLHQAPEATDVEPCYRTSAEPSGACPIGLHEMQVHLQATRTFCPYALPELAKGCGSLLALVSGSFDGAALNCTGCSLLMHSHQAAGADSASALVGWQPPYVWSGLMMTKNNCCTVRPCIF
jgi:hypothetical protein